MSEENIVDTPEVTEEVAPVIEETPAAESVAEVTPVPAIEEEVEGKTVGVIETGAIGSTTTKTPKKTKADKPAPIAVEDKVAIYSTKNVSWQEVGKVSVGINIVTPAEAEKWLKRNHIRIATPQEVAKEYNV